MERRERGWIERMDSERGWIEQRQKMGEEVEEREVQCKDGSISKRMGRSEGEHTKERGFLRMKKETRQ